MIPCVYPNIIMRLNIYKKLTLHRKNGLKIFSITQDINYYSLICLPSRIWVPDNGDIVKMQKAEEIASKGIFNVFIESG